MSQHPANHNDISRSVRLRMGVVPREFVVELIGDFDAENAAAVSRYLLRLPTGAGMTVDLSGVEFLGSAGLALLIRLSERLAEADAELRLIGVSSAIRRLILLLGIRDVLPCEPALTKAQEHDLLATAPARRRLAAVSSRAAERAGRPKPLASAY